MNRGIWIALALHGVGAASAAASNLPDKSPYHLFNPTPEELMRPLFTDRPDKTEAPFTVDAGRFQIETDVVTYTRDRGRSSYAVNLMNFKAGLTPSADLQVIFETFGKSGAGSGIGDTTLRFKQNLLGNDGGPIAIAVMPYVTFPTQDRSRGESQHEVGVLFPFYLELPKQTGLGFMFQLDRASRTKEVRMISSVALSHSLGFGLEGYIEFFSQSSTQNPWVATVDGGVILPIGKHLQLDLGANIGVTEAADDFNPFLGFTIRF